MRKKHVYQNVDGLIQGIEAILSENRCSFSDEEKVLLTNVISYLNESKKIGSKNPIDWSSVMKGIELLTKVFINSDKLFDIF